MIVVKMEIWPKGSRCGRVEVGAMTIVNCSPDDQLASADYAVRLYRGDQDRDLDQVVRDARWTDVRRSGLVTGFKRLRRNGWSLLFLAIASLRPVMRDGDDIDLGPLE